MSDEIDRQIDIIIDGLVAVKRFDAQIPGIESDLARGLGRDDVVSGSRKYGWLKRELVAERRARNKIIRAAEARLEVERNQ